MQGSIRLTGTVFLPCTTLHARLLNTYDLVPLKNQIQQVYTWLYQITINHNSKLLCLNQMLPTRLEWLNLHAVTRMKFSPHSTYVCMGVLLVASDHKLYYVIKPTSADAVWPWESKPKFDSFTILRAFCKASSNRRPMAITSPTLFIELPIYRLNKSTGT